MLIALENLSNNIKNTNPNKIIFISKTAYDKGFNEYSINDPKYLDLRSQIIVSICHTRYSEWELGYDKYNQAKGRQKLIDILVSIREKKNF